MPSPAALDSARTGTPDNSNGIQIATVVAQEGTIEIPGGIALSDRIASSLAADVDTLTATTLIPSGSDLGNTTWTGTTQTARNVNNRGAIVIWCHFEGASDSATLRVAYYDAADVALFVGPALNFMPTTFIKLASETPDMYVSEPQLVESYGAAKYRIMVIAYSGTNDLDVFSQPI